MPDAPRDPGSRGGAAPPLRIHVDPLPLPAGRRDEDAYRDVVILVDVLRTATLVPILFDRGLRAARLSPSLRVARRAAAASGDLLVGERHGLPPEGFNHGASPAAFVDHDLGGRSAVMVSENAPAALPDVAGARLVVLASLVNARAAAAFAARRATARIDLVCCGFRGEADLDDLGAAGLLVDLLRRARPDATTSGAAALASNLVRVGPDPLALLWHSSTGRYLRGLGLDRDLGAAADLDRSDAVPLMGRPEAAHGGTLYPFAPATGG